MADSMGLPAGIHVAVTGASSGIGAEIAGAFARHGASLTLLGRNAERLGARARLMREAGAPRTHTEAGDLAVEGFARAALARAAAAFGPVQVLVNCAGAAESAPLDKVTPEMLERVLAVNFKQVLWCTQAVLPAMVAAGFGRIVNIASTAALTGYAYVSAYGAAKHAVLGLTRALALEVVRAGVTVNAICPGYTDTPLIDAAVERIRESSGRDAESIRASLTRANPMGRMVSPREVAHAALWLAHPDSASITGQAIAIAGGEVLAG